MTGAELRHMTAFLEVARCGSFTRAAEELHICQPALPSRSNSSNTQHLWSDRMAAFVPVRHPLTRKRAVTFRELASYPLILTRRDSSVRVLVDRMLERERISVNVVHEASYVSTLIALVAAGLGISILPEREFSTALEALVRMLPLRPPALIRHIGIIGSTARSFSPAAEKFADVLRQTAAPPSQSVGEPRRSARREVVPAEGATMLRGQRAAR